MAVKECVVCGGPFDARPHNSKAPVGHSFPVRVHNAVTCGDDCAYARQLENNMRHYYRNPDKMKARSARYREKNISSITEKQKQYYWDNRTALLEKSRKWREENRDDLLERKRAYRSETSAANRLLREVSKFGTDALSPDFQIPKDVARVREVQRRHAKKRRDAGLKYVPTPEKSSEYYRKADAKRTAARALLKQIEEKGIEALL